MEKSTPSLWQCIEALVKSIPFTQKKVESVLGISLAEARRNESFAFIEGRDARLSSGQNISLVDLRLRLNRPGPGFLVLTVDGACTTLDEVRLHYSELKITDRPRGRSLNEETAHTGLQPWGKISFGFAERNPECLSSVVLAPKDNL